MKLVLFVLFIFGFAILLDAMQQNIESFFPLEGKHLTGPQLLQKYGAWYPGYDTDDKFYEFHHHPVLFANYRNAIINKKLGTKVLEFVQSQQNHVWSQAIIRYSKAVTFRLATVCTSEATDEQLIEAEGQIPYNYKEYFYITLGNNVNCTLYENEEINIPSLQQYRNKLNSFLNNFKTQIENSYEK